MSFYSSHIVVPKAMPSNKTIIYCIIAFTLLYIFWYLKSENGVSSPLPFSATYVEHKRDPLQKLRHILVWTDDAYSHKWGLLGQTMGEDYFHDCPMKNCIITANRSRLEDHKFDAIFFNVAEFHEGTKTPKSRSPHQFYVFGVTETPSKNMVQINDLIFNFTCEFFR